MRYHLLVAAAALTLVACDRTPTAPTNVGQGFAAPPVNIATVRGVVHADMDSTGMQAFTLKTGDGTIYNLLGPLADEVATAATGMEIMVTGELAAGAIYVESYQLVDSEGCKGQIVDDPTGCLVRVDARRLRRRP